MKFSKKHLALGLSVLLICGIAAVAASAAGSNNSEPDTGGSKSSFFTDIPSGAAYEDAVNWCYENGLMNGMGGTNFSPDATLNRAMVATILYRAAGEPAVSGAPAFEDTKADDWYSDAVVWASQNGIVAGYGDGRFGTDDPITQEQLDVMIRRH